VPDGAVGIDYLIGDEGRTGQGLGTDMIGAFVALTWQDHPSASAVIVDIENTNALAALSAAMTSGDTRDIDTSLDVCIDRGLSAVAEVKEAAKKVLAAAVDTRQVDFISATIAK
jgi:hypothetical protein